MTGKWVEHWRADLFGLFNNGQMIFLISGKRKTGISRAERLLKFKKTETTKIELFQHGYAELETKH
jgi:hypothetical protein